MLESEEWCHNFHPMRTALKASNSMSCNDVKSILGRIHKNPNAGKKIHEKKRQRPWTFIFKVPWKFSEETYETIFETLRALFLILLREIFYGSKILSTDTKSSIISALGALHKRLKSPDLAFFWAGCCGTSSQYLAVRSSSTYHKDLKLGQ